MKLWIGVFCLSWLVWLIACGYSKDFDGRMDNTDMFLTIFLAAVVATGVWGMFS